MGWLITLFSPGLKLIWVQGNADANRRSSLIELKTVGLDAYMNYPAIQKIQAFLAEIGNPSSQSKLSLKNHYCKKTKCLTVLVSGK